MALLGNVIFSFPVCDKELCLAKVAHLVGCHPVHLMVIGLIPGQSYALVGGLIPSQGSITDQSMFLSYINVSLSACPWIRI